MVFSISPRVSLISYYVKIWKREKTKLAQSMWQSFNLAQSNEVNLSFLQKFVFAFPFFLSRSKIETFMMFIFGTPRRQIGSKHRPLERNVWWRR